MKSLHDVVVRPIITEDSMEMARNRKYVFEVRKDCNKVEIKEAVEKLFKVEVANVNTLNVPGKQKRLGNRPQGSTSTWKKAFVTLTPDSRTIEFFDGMY